MESVWSARLQGIIQLGRQTQTPQQRIRSAVLVLNEYLFGSQLRPGPGLAIDRIVKKVPAIVLLTAYQKRLQALNCKCGNFDSKKEEKKRAVT